MDLQVSSKRQRQHYVPKVYLKRFAKPDGRITVKNIQDPGKPEFTSGLGQVCLERGIYDLSSLNFDGVPANAYESLLSQFEAQYDICLKQSTDQQRFPTPAEARKIALFVIYQLLRTPGYRSMIADAMREKLSGHPMANKVTFAAVSLTHTIIGIPQLLEHAEYQIIESAPGTTFVTSDNPATAWLSGGIQWERVEGRLEESAYVRLRIICPLSPRFLFVIQPLSLEPDKCVRRGSNKSEVERFNGRIQAAAHRFLIC